MKNIIKSSAIADWGKLLFTDEWNVVLPFSAITFAYLATYDSAPWMRALAIVNICALLAIVYWSWALGCCQRLGDILPSLDNEAEAESDEALNPAARAVAFEDRVNVSIVKANRYGRHAGVISLWWAPGVDVDSDQDVESLRQILLAHLDPGSVIHLADQDRAWVLVDMLRSFDELQRVQERLVQVLARQTETPLRTIASGCGIAPMHGYDARDLIEFADENQEHQIRIHPFQTYARAQGRALPSLTPFRSGWGDRIAV